MVKIKTFILLFFIVSFSFVQQTATAQTKRKYLIYFTNKNNNPYSLSNPLQFLSQRSIDRRSRQGIPLTFKDLPVNPAYVDSIKSKGGEVWYSSRWFNAALVNADSSQLAEINQLSFVKQASKVARLGSSNALNSATEIEKELEAQNVHMDYGNSLNQASMIEADVMHSEGYHGEGMVIAVLDAGYLNANTLSFFDSLHVNNQVLGTFDFVSKNPFVYSYHGHGTQVLSTMAGYEEGKLIGTAYKAKYLLLRTEDGNSEKMIEEVNWLIAAEYADSAGADLINSSLGYTTFTDGTSHTYSELNGNTTIITRAADFAAGTGMVVLNSAGNDGSEAWKYISAPADADSIITVAAVDASGNYASFSSVGPSSDGRVKPDLAAQGSDAIIGNTNGTVGPGSGTSFSCPILCGMVAGFWQAHPYLTNMQVIDFIRRSGSTYETPNEKIGYGIPSYVRAKQLVLSTEETVESIFKIVPNPLSKEDALFLFTELTGMGESFNLKLFDMTGRVVGEQELRIDSNKSEIKINTGHLPEGIYILSLSGNGVNQKIKLIIR